MFRIYPYRAGSKSVRRLIDTIGGRIIRLKNTRYRYRDSHILINWGNSHVPDWLNSAVKIFNHPDNVAIASNKLSTFKTLAEKDVPTVEFTESSSTASAWTLDGSKVFARKLLQGHSGEGIQVVKENTDRSFLDDISNRLEERGYYDMANILDTYVNEDEIAGMPDAPLYTRGVQNYGEYRVHVVNGNVILYQKKSRRRNDDGEVEEVEASESDVRNLESGWVYRTGNLNRLERVEELAIGAVSALGLDFGAVDIIMDEDGNVLVLEINTAPGLGNTDTMEAYTRAFTALT